MKPSKKVVCLLPSCRGEEYLPRGAVPLTPSLRLFGHGKHGNQRSNLSAWCYSDHSWQRLVLLPGGSHSPYNQQFLVHPNRKSSCPPPPPPPAPKRNTMPRTHFTYRHEYIRPKNANESKNVPGTILASRIEKWEITFTSPRGYCTSLQDWDCRLQ